MPTGLVILILNRYSPESPRFLSNAGLESQARAVLRKFSGSASTIEHDDPKHPGAPALDDPHVVRGMRALLRGRHARITWGPGVCGVAWGLVNFGVFLWLPVNLVKFGGDAAGVTRVLRRQEGRRVE